MKDVLLADVVSPPLGFFQGDPISIAIVVLVLALVAGLGFWLGRRKPALPEPPKAKAPLAPAGPSALDRFRQGFARTADALRLSAIFSGPKVDSSLFDALEEALISADVGVRTTTDLLDELREATRRGGVTDPAALRKMLRENLLKRLKRHDPALRPPPPEGPQVILVVGVNGAGKTTTIGKLAARFKAEGRSVLLGAGDTFRAGAIDQLRIWSERAQADFVAHQEGSDPAAVLHDAIDAAKARGVQVVIADTAGRLQSRKPLMDELGKITRVLGRAVSGAPHEVLLVLDGTMGQNAISQARIFGEITGVTGVALTKLDGTAKGGVVVAVMEELNMPVKLVGIGEKIDDLRPFDPEAFVDALLGPA